MKTSAKIMKSMAILLFLCFFFSACGDKEPIDAEITDIPSVSLTNITEPMPTISFTPSQLKTIIYYTISDDLKKEEATAVLKADMVLTPEFLIQYVVEAMEDSSVEVKISKVEVENKSVVISFEKDSAPVAGTSAELEADILDAIAQSILENFDEYKRVIYRVEGGAYRSENRSFDKNYVYLEK